VPEFSEPRLGRPPGWLRRDQRRQWPHRYISVSKETAAPYGCGRIVHIRPESEKPAGSLYAARQEESGHAISHETVTIADWIWLTPRGPADLNVLRMVLVLLAAIGLIAGVIMAGTSVMT
jgi:hypothetical protein